MAIITQVPGLIVTITNHTEYLDPDDEQPEGIMTKYIEAESGKTFSVTWSFEQSFPYKQHDIVSRVYLDGKHADGIIFLSANIGRPGGWHAKLIGARTRKDRRWYEHKLSFANLEIDENNGGINEPGLRKKATSLGEISIRLWRVKNVQVQESIEDQPLSFGAWGVVPEKALKGRGISHQARLEDGEPTGPVTQSKSEYIDPLDKPFAGLNFRYRPYSGLQALGLIPRTPEPVPLEERPIESLTSEEMRILLRRQREQRNVAKKEPRVKRERAGSDDRDDDRGGRRQRQRSTTAQPIEKIDLTGD